MVGHHRAFGEQRGEGSALRVQVGRRVGLVGYGLAESTMGGIQFFDWGCWQVWDWVLEVGGVFVNFWFGRSVWVSN